MLYVFSSKRPHSIYHGVHSQFHPTWNSSLALSVLDLLNLPTLLNLKDKALMWKGDCGDGGTMMWWGLLHEGVLSYGTGFWCKWGTLQWRGLWWRRTSDVTEEPLLWWGTLWSEEGFWCEASFHKMVVCIISGFLLISNIYIDYNLDLGYFCFAYFSRVPCPNKGWEMLPYTIRYYLIPNKHIIIVNDYPEPWKGHNISFNQEMEQKDQNGGWAKCTWAWFRIKVLLPNINPIKVNSGQLLKPSNGHFLG